jgi:hypothetical protein
MYGHDGLGVQGQLFVGWGWFKTLWMSSLNMIGPKKSLNMMNSFASVLDPIICAHN